VRKEGAQKLGDSAKEKASYWRKEIEKKKKNGLTQSHSGHRGLGRKEKIKGKGFLAEKKNCDKRVWPGAGAMGWQIASSFTGHQE